MYHLNGVKDLMRQVQLSVANSIELKQLEVVYHLDGDNFSNISICNFNVVLY